LGHNAQVDAKPETAANPAYAVIQQNFIRLGDLLADHHWLWHPQPYKTARPEWCRHLPGLTGALLELSDQEVATLEADHMLLIRLLASHVPALVELESLIALPERVKSVATEASPHLQWEIPGRKWAQIEAFADSIGPVHGPLLDWCGGRGHLGRLLSKRWQVPVTTLELDSRLCLSGAHLARRARVPQDFINTDALATMADGYLSGRHVVALHACGDLHRSLVHRAVENHATALDISPCCFHLTGGNGYRPYAPQARLALSKEDLRLAVTETVTASPREVQQRNREMAWKLGFEQLRRDAGGAGTYHSIKPIDKSWLKLGFGGFCQALARREGLPLPAEVDWSGYEILGWQRQREVIRLSLVRQGFRRALEVWLVLDMANYLADNGYRVVVGTFCERRVSPRNILISARKVW
jgi:hypothetical protein